MSLAQPASSSPASSGSDSSSSGSSGSDSSSSGSSGSGSSGSGSLSSKSSSGLFALRAPLASELVALESLLDEVFGVERVERSIYVLRRRYFLPVSLVACAPDGEGFAGCALASLVKVPDKRRAVLFGPLGVRERWQRLGLAKSLIEGVVLAARHLEFGSGERCAGIIASAAHAHYWRAGFREDAVRGLELPPSTPPHRFMGLSFDESTSLGATPGAVVAESGLDLGRA